MDSFLLWLLNTFDFFASGLGILLIGAVAIVMLLFWEWRVLLLGVCLIQIGVVELMTKIYGLHLEWVDGTCTVIPSHPSIRLWEDSQEALIAEAVLVAPPLEFTSKARLLAGADVAFCAQPLPLGCVYFLGGTEVSSVVITRMPPAAAMIELVKNAFLLDVEDRNLLALHFDELSQLANLPIYYHLDYPRRYDYLPQVRASITSHCIEQVSHLL